MIRLLRNRNFILLAAVALGIAAGKPVSSATSHLVLPLLALVMTLAATNVSSHELASQKNILYPISLAFFLNYIIMGGLTIVLAYWLFHGSDLWVGFVVLAAVPPAVGVIPFTYIFGGNTLLSLVGVTITYLLALVIMPVIITLFLGTSYFDPVRVIIILGELVVLPIILSRIILKLKLAAQIRPWQGTVTNWSFFIIIYTIVGLNQSAFFGEWGTLGRLIAVAVAISFVLGLAIDVALKLYRVPRETRISLVLLGTTKNYALASGILLSLFDDRVALPASICAMFGVLNTVWLGFYFRPKT